MIRVTVERAEGGHIRRFSIDGHAGFARHGSDIVCAAASVTVYTAAGALCEICGAGRECVSERSGHFELRVPEFGDGRTARDASVITEAAYIGFRQIEASYPKHLVTETVT